jgi:hypothetical protein
VFGSDAKFEEKISDIRIQTDGDVGTVYYTYEFFRNEKLIRNGSKSWHLVRNFNGWRINSMLSSHLNIKSHSKNGALKSVNEVLHVFLSGETAVMNRDEAGYFSDLLHPYILYLPIDSSRRRDKLYTQQGNEAYVPVMPWVFWSNMENLGPTLLSNQTITTDEEIASIYLKYEDTDGMGEKTGVYGYMATDFVRTPDGWKMVAKTFSVNSLPK